jgi:hypothetical protein
MAKKEQFTEEDDALLAELGVEVEAKKAAKYTDREQRIIAGFEEIQRFVEEYGRLPEHGEDKDIFERLYAVRLDRIRSQKECWELLKDLDIQNLLSAENSSDLSIPDDIEDEELLKELGVDSDSEASITNLKHVKSRAEKRAAEEIANRTRCEDFDHFKPLFETIKKEIDAGIRETLRFRKDAGFTKTILKKAQFLIVGGQIALIAEVGESFKAPNGEEDARLRVIYSNGTESNILLRSLIRAMYKDETSRFITDPNLGPLFSSQNSDDDQESGTIYVLRSLSSHPIIQKSKDIVHKIGVTGSDIKTRIANAKNDPTFLMADVEVIATYKLANINRVKLEKIIHKFFDSAKLEIEVRDRFGKAIKVREWFLVPLFIIDEVVDKIKDGTISDYYYDPTLAELKR